MPKTLRPVFRDRFDFSAGGSLRAQTLEALDQSNFLIVICSPGAARSEAVFEEIRLYKARRGERRILPIIIDGEPGDPVAECFPRSLAFRVLPNGDLTDEPEHPIAADARSEGDGRFLARLKITSGLLGIPLDLLYRREARARRRQLRWRSALAGVMALMAAGATVSAWTALRQAMEGERLLQIAFDATSGVSRRSADLRDQFAVPVPAIASMLNEAEGTLLSATEGGVFSRTSSWADLRRLVKRLFEDPALSKEARYRKALMLMSFADSYRTLGEIGQWLDRAESAQGLLLGLVATDPDVAEYQQDLMRAHNAVGDALTQKHDLAGALKAYGASHAIATRLTQREPGNVEFQSALAKASNEFGDAYTQSGDLDGAMQSYKVAFDIRKRLSEADAASPRWQRDLSISWNQIGDTHRHKKELGEALASYEQGFAIRKRLVADFPGNQTHERDLSISYNLLGDTLLLLGDVTAAHRHFETSFAIRKRHVEYDSRNVLRQRDMAFAHYRVGGTLLRLKKREEGLVHLRGALAIFQRLAQSDPLNARWQMDVNNALWRLADADDEPRRRFEVIVGSMRRLRDGEQLLPEHLPRLAQAEARLATLFAEGR